MGAMASKNARCSAPVSLPIAAVSVGEVSGPVATMTLFHSSGGRPAISPRTRVTNGSAARAAVTWAEKASRSMARAPPAGTLLASAAARIRLSQQRISSCNRPTAEAWTSSERKEFEQTNSARPSVSCASVMRSGRISCKITGTPARAICQAASEPARPPPITWIVFCSLMAG